MKFLGKYVLRFIIPLFYISDCIATLPLSSKVYGRIEKGGKKRSNWWE